MNAELFSRIAIQLEPELAQEFGYAILEDKKKLKVLEIIKEKVSPLLEFTAIKKAEDKDKDNTYYTINNNWDDTLYLTQAEFDLLKEVVNEKEN